MNTLHHPTPSGPLARVAVAIDTADWAELVRWCEFFGPRVGALKIGLEAYVRFGPRAAETARRFAQRLFLDLKLHDIPNTVAAAAAAARDVGADLLTVHAGGGAAMVEAAVQAARPAAVVAVSVLTSLDAAQLAELNLPGSAAERVLMWSRLAARAGARGAVCSPNELRLLRRAHDSDFLLVTPGIRPTGSATDDQRRVATPQEALRDGASLLVIGRPLTRSPDPEGALSTLELELGANCSPDPGDTRPHHDAPER